MAAAAPVAPPTAVRGEVRSAARGRRHRPAHARPSRLGELLRAIGTGLSAGLLLLVLGLTVLVIGVPAAVGGMPLTILTGSMSPGLPPGTLIVVRPVDPAEIRIGDVLSYQLESGKPAVVTHRVVERTVDVRTGEYVFRTQGDANGTPDAVPVMPVQIKGVVWYSVPLLGWVNQLVTGELRAWLIPLAAAALFGYAGWTVVGGLRERRRNQRVTRQP